MGRGKDKTIKHTDFPNMSQRELNNAIAAATSIRGTAAVRKAGSGEVRYGKHARKGAFNEDKLS